jgi:predicted nuclease of predicted toxin-antitoxin system
VTDLTFWLDAHLRPDLADWIGSRFNVIAKSLREIDLNEAKDPVIFDAARRFGKIVVVTKDEDFVELVERFGPPPQVLWLTVGNLTTIELQLVLVQAFEEAVRKLVAGAPVVEISRQTPA